MIFKEEIEKIDTMAKMIASQIILVNLPTEQEGMEDEYERGFNKCLELVEEEIKQYQSTLKL